MNLRTVCEKEGALKCEGPIEDKCRMLWIESMKGLLKDVEYEKKRFLGIERNISCPFLFFRYQF
jgi:hypothetical protein